MLLVFSKNQPKGKKYVKVSTICENNHILALLKIYIISFKSLEGSLKGYAQFKKLLTINGILRLFGETHKSFSML